MDGSGSPSGQKEGFGFGNLCSSLQRRALHCSILLSAMILKIIYLEEYKNTQRIITLAGALQSSISFLQSCSCNAIAFDKERIRRRGKEENGIKEEDEKLEEGEKDEKETGKSCFLDQLSLQYIFNFSRKGILYTTPRPTNFITFEI